MLLVIDNRCKMWVELSSKSVTSMTLYDTLLRTNLLHEKPMVVFSPHTLACEARALHTQRSHLQRFAPSENIQKQLFCSLDPPVNLRKKELRAPLKTNNCLVLDTWFWFCIAQTF